MNENLNTLKATSNLQPLDPLRRLLAQVRIWNQRRRGRRQLAQMPPYLLHDVGISEADRYQEINKPFWKP